MSSEDRCEICHHPAFGRHFSVLSCRACGTFFRRSIQNQRRYECLREKRCAMTKDMRYSCRWCRLQRCLEKGMNANAIKLSRQLEADEENSDCNSKSNQLVRKQKLRSSQTSEPLQSTTLEIVIPIPVCVSNQANLLNQMTSGYENYHKEQRSIFHLLYHNEDPNEFRNVDLKEHIRMERACQSLLFEMLNTHFKPFDKLNLQTKQTILQAISPFFGMFDQCSLTSTTFPEIDDMRYCLHIGQHLHRNQMEKFFSFDPDPSTSIRSSQVLGEHLRILLNKLRTMKIRRSEAAALIGLVLWNEVSLLSFDYATLADQTRNQIFRDLYSDCSKNHADEGAYSRMGSLIFMLKDLNQICQLMLESVTIGRLFSSQPEIFNS